MPFGPLGVRHVTWPYRLLPIGDFRPTPESQSGGQSAEVAGLPRNEGEAEW